MTEFFISANVNKNTNSSGNSNSNGLKKNSSTNSLSSHENSERQKIHRINLDLFIAGNTLLKEHRFINLFSHHSLTSIFYYDCLNQNIKLFSSKEMLNWKNNSLAVMPFPEPLSDSNIFSHDATLHVHFAIPNQKTIIQAAQEKTLNFYFLLSMNLKTVYGYDGLIFNDLDAGSFFKSYYDSFEIVRKIIQKNSDKFKSHMTDWAHFMAWKYHPQEIKPQVANKPLNAVKPSKKLKKILATAQKHQMDISDDTTLYHFSNSGKLHIFSKKFERQKLNQKKLLQKDLQKVKSIANKTHGNASHAPINTALPEFASVYEAQCLVLFSTIEQHHALPIELEKKLQVIMKLFQQIANYKIEKLHDNLTYFDQLLFWQLKSLLLAQKTPHLQMEQEIIQIIDKIQPQLEALNEQFLNTLLIQQDNHADRLKVTLKDKFKF